MSHGGWRCQRCCRVPASRVSKGERCEMKIMIRFVKMRCVVKVLTSKGLMLPFSLRLGVALVLHKDHLCNLV